jgi:sialate O-acetylesterase
MKKWLLALVAAVCCLTLNAEVRLPSVLGDNMVLQRNSEVNLWGWAQPGKKVRVKTSWNRKRYRVRADAEGKWLVKVRTGEAGGPYTITISDGQQVKLENILLGEVWICAGQSNMEMPVQGYLGQPCLHAAETMREARLYPDVRLFTVGRDSTDVLKDDCQGEWLLSNPATVGAFSAVGYFYGRCLNQYLGVPIGLITTNWGGTNIEAWMSTESTARVGIDGEYTRTHWNEDYFPCGTLYNGMVAPLTPFTAKGFIWYQGESNRGNWEEYAQLQAEMIRQWREAWGDEKMPFYLTQIAPYRYEGAEKRRSALLVEKQIEATALVPYCAMASTTDLGLYSLIHEPDKRSVGERLAWLALSRDYGVPGVPADAPTYKSLEIKDGRAVVSFNNLCAPNDQSDPRSFSWLDDAGEVVRSVKGFEIAGADRKFHPAQARLLWNDNQVEVWSDQVKDPVAVRYCFCNYAETNLKTTLGQPIVPFRTDDWDIPEEEI